MNLTKIFVQSFFIYLPLFVSASPLSQFESTKQISRSILTAKPKTLGNLKSNNSFLQNQIKSSLILDNSNLFKSLEKITSEGPRTGGGGNACSLSIAQNTKNLIIYLEQISDLFDSSQMTQLMQAIKSAKFYLSTNMQLGKETKDAINYPAEGIILLSPRTCRNELMETTGRSMALLLHEYLGLARIEDRQYTISGTFMDLYSKLQEQKNEVTTYLENEVKKELEGKQSCLRGKIAKKSKEMEENYGGRYSKNIEVQTVLQDSSEYRYLAKYCDGSLDKNMKPTTDEGKIVYRHCVSTDSFTYIAVFRFGGSTSGSFEFEGLHLPVKVGITHDVVVKADADYNPEESDIVKNNTSTKIICGQN